MQFRKAVKYAAKGRVALVGPAGAGKTYTGLVLARVLAGPHGKIAAIDTEHGSMSKYADLFDFDVLELASFGPQTFMEALRAAEQAKYDVFFCDSLSHFWIGKDGALEFVDERKARHKDQMGGWKDFRPHERAMVDAMIASPCHVICTMRTKNDYAEVEENGKKKRVKIGLAPVQRDGLEYEFDLVGYMNDECTLVVDKTRCPAYSQRSIRMPKAEDFGPFVTWLAGVSPAEPPAQVVAIEQANELAALLIQAQADVARFLAYFRVADVKQLPAAWYDRAKGMLQQKISGAAPTTNGATLVTGQRLGDAPTTANVPARAAPQPSAAPALPPADGKINRAQVKELMELIERKGYPPPKLLQRFSVVDLTGLTVDQYQFAVSALTKMPDVMPAGGVA